MELSKLIVSMAGLMSITSHESYDAEKLTELIGGEFDESFTDSLGNRFFVKRCGKEKTRISYQHLHGLYI